MSEARGRTRSAKARMPCTSSSSNEELSEVQGNAPVHQVWEDEATRVVLLDADGQLVGETADRLSRRRSEGDVRIILGPQAGLLREVEEGSLVGFGTQPPAPSIPQHSIENHHPFDHPADRPKATVAVVGLANCFVERSMVDVYSRPRRTGPGSMARANPRSTSLAMNSRLFWPRTVAVNSQYWRSRKHPEWTMTATRN
jgi:hypothetical protein